MPGKRPFSRTQFRYVRADDALAYRWHSQFTKQVSRFQMSKMQGAMMTTRTTLKLAVLAAGTIFSSIAAQATTVNFDFRTGGTNVGSGFGNVRTFTDAGTGIVVTATAWGLANTSGNFA